MAIHELGHTVFIYPCCQTWLSVQHIFFLHIGVFKLSLSCSTIAIIFLNDLALMSKSDFLSWDDDIDLETLLGEYTENDHDVTDSESDDYSASVGHRTKVRKLGKDSYVYICPVCDKSLKTISGFRGHTSKQHHKDFKASEHRSLTSKSSVQLKPPVEDSSKSFPETFQAALSKTLNNIESDPFVFLDNVNLTDLCNFVTGSNSVKLSLQETLQPVFSSPKCRNNICSSSDREEFFRLLHKCRTDIVIIEKLVKLFPQFDSIAVRTFLQLIFEDIVGEFVIIHTKCATEVSEKCATEISDNDQTILFYICGYILKKLQVKYRCSHYFQQIVNCVATESSKAKFIQKYDKWYRLQTRGGLRRPIDDFYLLVRECEIVVRSCVGSVLSASSLLVDPLRERIMESFMVKHYCSKMFSSDSSSSFVLEDIITLFLTIRGFAVTRLKRNELNLQAQQGKKSASLRQTLQDKNAKNK